MHIRQKIRESLVTLLNNSKTLPTAQTNRATPLSETERPALIVTSGPESVESNVQLGNGQQRVYTIYVSIQVSNNDVVEDTLDQYILEVEQAINTWDYRSVSNDIVQIVLTGIDQLLTDEPSQFVGEATLTFDIPYRTTDSNPVV